MKKIEEVTCIKFENRTKNHHKERVLELYKISLELIFMMRLKEESLSSQAVVLPRAKTSKKDFIRFRPGFGCYSNVGRNGGQQDISLFPKCAQEHTLIHEVSFSIKT